MKTHLHGNDVHPQAPLWSLYDFRDDTQVLRVGTFLWKRAMIYKYRYRYMMCSAVTWKTAVCSSVGVRRLTSGDAAEWLLMRCAAITRDVTSYWISEATLTTLTRVRLTIPLLFARSQRRLTPLASRSSPFLCHRTRSSPPHIITIFLSLLSSTTTMESSGEP